MGGVVAAILVAVSDESGIEARPQLPERGARMK
jgi:hypothetical protein